MIKGVKRCAVCGKLFYTGERRGRIVCCSPACREKWLNDKRVWDGKEKTKVDVPMLSAQEAKREGVVLVYFLSRVWRRGQGMKLSLKRLKRAWPQIADKFQVE